MPRSLRRGSRFVSFPVWSCSKRESRWIESLGSRGFMGPETTSKRTRCGVCVPHKSWRIVGCCVYQMDNEVGVLLPALLSDMCCFIFCSIMGTILQLEARLNLADILRQPRLQVSEEFDRPATSSIRHGYQRTVRKTESDEDSDFSD